MVPEAEEEFVRSMSVLDHAGGEGVKERVTSRLSRIEAHAGRRIAIETGMLATIGATAAASAGIPMVTATGAGPKRR